MKINRYFIIDFDSTFVKVEALDELAQISLKSHPQKDAVCSRINKLTVSAMNGEMPFAESLARRLQLIKANKEHISKLVKKLNRLVSSSVTSNKDFFRKFSDNIIILSGGFHEYILPVVEKYGIKPENVYANSFIFNSKGEITGFSKKSLLAQAGGKVKQLKALKLKGEIIAIGDGYTDYELKSSGMIDRFYAFTENIERTSVTKKC